VGVLAAHLGDRFCIGCVDRELELHVVGRLQIHRYAIAVVDDAQRHLGRIAALLDFVKRLLRHLERGVQRAANFLHDRLVLLIGFVIGELEERQGATVGELVEGVTVIDLAADLGAEHALAPGGGQRNAEHAFDELAVCVPGPSRRTPGGAGGAEARPTVLLHRSLIGSWTGPCRA